MDTPRHLLALHVTPADVGDHQAVARLAANIQEATGDTVKLAYVDQGYTGDKPSDAAAAEGITLDVVNLPEAKGGFVLLPRCREVFAWATRCRRLVKDYERYAETLAGLHVAAFVGYMLKYAEPLVRSALHPLDAAKRTFRLERPPRRQRDPPSTRQTQPVARRVRLRRATRLR